MESRRIPRGGMRGRPISTACVCGLTHPSQKEARACQRQIRSLLSVYWDQVWDASPSDEDRVVPRVFSVPQKVLRAIRTVCQWVGGEVGRRKDGDPAPSSPSRPLGPRMGWWRFKRRQHLCKTDARGTRRLDGPVCGIEEAPYDVLRCPRCVKWLQEAEAPAKEILIERRGPGSELQAAVRFQAVNSLHPLSEYERDVLMLRFGLEDGQARSFEEVGEAFEVSSASIRRIEKEALRKFRAACSPGFLLLLERAKKS